MFMMMLFPILLCYTNNRNSCQYRGINPVPLLIAFITRVNIGGNFLPQGYACDMMTLELATKECVPGLT